MIKLVYYGFKSNSEGLVLKKNNSKISFNRDSFIESLIKMIEDLSPFNGHGIQKSYPVIDEESVHILDIRIPFNEGFAIEVKEFKKRDDKRLLKIAKNITKVSKESSFNCHPIVFILNDYSRTMIKEETINDVQFIFYSLKNEPSHKRLEKLIKKYVISSLSKNSLNDIEQNQPYNVFEKIPFNYFNKHYESALKFEYKVYEEEYKSKHYPSAMLRLGRILEQTVYASAKIMDINIRSHHFTDEQKGNIDKYLVNEANEIYSKLVELISNKSDLGEIGLSINQLNRFLKLNGAKTNIRSRTNYKSLGNILKEIELKITPYIINNQNTEISKCISGLKVYPLIMQSRHKTAHPNPEGKISEFSKKQIDATTDNLVSFLESLAAIVNFYVLNNLGDLSDG